MSEEPLPQSISAQDAQQLLLDEPRAILIDVRSSMEFLFVGHPIGAIHIAWIDEPDWDINPDFCSEVKKVLAGGIESENASGAAPIILICRSGKRSLVAGKSLLNSGLSQVYNIHEGFEGELNEQHQRSTINGWRYQQLPWEQC
ncbi:MAG: rhodanese-like domain-containing protein [gamma proteobacterium symbiont of Bathyaustriella thionipta]|nr:rhodanese-like domain-containing protein [gamma proteobacterium symbiont of Bathyaustriella thionipta]